MGTLNRRAFLRIAALGAAASAATRIVAPVRAASPAGLAAQDDAWKKEWADLVAAATEEGTLSLLTWGLTWGGSGYPTVIASFEQAFPGIRVDHLPESSARVWLEKLRQDRRAGAFSFDLALVQPEAALTVGRSEGMWAPIKPLLFRPDVLDDAAWRHGVDGRYLDDGGELCFAWEHQVLHTYSINTDLVQDGEITTVKDLLDPKWTGKIISSDPRIGIGLHSAAAVARSHGIDVVKQLLVDQRPTFSGEAPTLAGSLVHGLYPIALGVRPKALQPFRDQGLGHNVAHLDLTDADFAATTAMLYLDRAPHPAAARLFANWILTREGQALLTSSLPTNSARTDVEAFEPNGIGTVGSAYYEPDREANYQHTADTQKFIRGLAEAMHLPS